ncbi:hypothetical protein LguiA_000648 [Lonicera macranthoides]
MGIPDSSLLDLIEKVTSWISWGNSDLSLLPNCKMADTSCNLCRKVIVLESYLRFNCQRCGQILCENCIRGYSSSGVVPSGDSKSLAEAGLHIKSCMFCSDFSNMEIVGKKYCDKIHPSECTRQSPEPPSPSSNGGRVDGCYVPVGSSSPGSLHPTPSRFISTTYGVDPQVIYCMTDCRSDEDEGEDSAKHFFSSYCNDTSDIDSSSVSDRHEFYSLKSVGSSPLDSPSRIHITSNRVGHSVQQEHGGPLDQQQTMAVSKGPENTYYCSDDLSIFGDQHEKLYKPLDFENNGLIWFPPPPEVEEDAENNFFAYDDEDDEIGESSAMFSSSNSLDSMFTEKEKENSEQKEPLRAVVQGHFRALVAQLLQGESIEVDKENSSEDWLDIVTRISWQAANFVKPDTSRGGSMDPGDYVKVKCIASGSPSESKLVKGVVCTKNIKHKRMTSQYKNPRLLVLGGALEYQRVTNQLASFDTLLQQEIDHLKMIVSKIEAHRPNVLLVEKSVSSYAQEYLLAKEISLVLNVKRPLLERIARCTGAPITPSIDKISTTWLGHCELFRLERVSEEHEAANQFNKKPTKTLMFFEGCPRRLGCTVLLKGSCREELKKLKHVIQYAVFAAYHLSLETSFLADEGASLPKITLKPSLAIPERTMADNAISVVDSPNFDAGPSSVNFELGEQELLVDHHNSSLIPTECGITNVPSDVFDDDLASPLGPVDIRNHDQEEEHAKLTKFERADEASTEYYSATDSHQSILVSFSSRCILNGTVCERSRLLRIKFYGCFDKPLGRYLRDDLFDQTCCCRSCNEPAEAHVICYTHQQGNLTINVKRIPSMKLPGERDGKIWMWHRCLRCAHIDGVPPATRRVIMSNAAWGLSFGKFLELSFSNHATANRVANCGHSLQRDCLRYYGFGSMAAFFRYSPIDILSVQLPPSVLEFNGHFQQNWLKKETAELCCKTEALYEEISGVLHSIEQKNTSFGGEASDSNDLRDHITEFKDLLIKERNNYNDLLQPAGEEFSEFGQPAVDILELNHLRHTLIIGSRVWNRRLYSLESLLKTKNFSPKITTSNTDLKEKTNLLFKEGSFDQGDEDNYPEFSKLQSSTSFAYIEEEDIKSGIEIAVNKLSLECVPSAASNLSEKIDSLWTGTDQSKEQLLHTLNAEQIENPSFRRILSPTRVYSFDSAVRIQERIKKGLPPSSLHLSMRRSFHASGDYRNMVRDPIPNVHRTLSQISPLEAQKRNLLLSTTPSLISSASLLPEGAHLMVQPNGPHNVVVVVYDNEPTSIISHALSSKEHEDWVADMLSNVPKEMSRENSVGSNLAAWQSFGSLDLDYIHYGSFGGSQDTSMTIGGLFTDPKTPHLKISFEDESPNAGGKVKFSVTCYFAKQFDAFRKKCCPGKLDFIRSLSRCKRWSAQGGKSNVFFAKSLDERFIIKQVTKTELESFEEFAPEYFKYLTDSLNSGSPTCLAKILGIYQVTVKHLKGGKETKMDLMVMENLFYKRSISRVYDLKGSARSRYNSDTTGSVDVMDYSLLVGVDDERKELVLGIIDFMRQYTWDKHLETWVKASGILGGPKNASPTIISPKQYKRRFRKAMTTYFLTVPDQWSP